MKNITLTSIFLLICSVSFSQTLELRDADKNLIINFSLNSDKLKLKSTKDGVIKISHDVLSKNAKKAFILKFEEKTFSLLYSERICKKICEYKISDEIAFSDACECFGNLVTLEELFVQTNNVYYTPRKQYANTDDLRFKNNGDK